MKCPYCNTEMILGYIQCRDGVYWSKRKRLIAALPALDESAVLLSFKHTGVLNATKLLLIMIKKSSILGKIM